MCGSASGPATPELDISANARSRIVVERMSPSSPKYAANGPWEPTQGPPAVAHFGPASFEQSSLFEVQFSTCWEKHAGPIVQFALTHRVLQPSPSQVGVVLMLVKQAS